MQQVMLLQKYNEHSTLCHWVSYSHCF